MAPGCPMRMRRLHPGLYLAAAGLLLCLAALIGLPAWLTVVPDELVPPLRKATGDFVNFLVRDLDIAGLTLRDITRGAAEGVRWPMAFLQQLLIRGFDLGGFHIQPLSWLSILGFGAWVGYTQGGWKLALAGGGALGYCALFGVWTDAMLTLASVSVAVVTGMVAGILLGIAAYRHRRVEAMLTPVYDLMQTVPIFAYLVPVLLLFGFGPVGALVATVTYALPPMARVTTLALRQVPAEIGEFATLAGASSRQRIWQVMLPAARIQLLVGLNQVIMLSFTMVIIASVIGAGGLGATVLKALQSLRFGLGLEAGLGITVIAIALDRISRAAALRRPVYRPAADQRRRRNLLLGSLVLILVVPTLGAFLMPGLALPPKSITISTAPFWDGLVSALNKGLASSLTEIKTVAFGYMLRPVRDVISALPWSGLVLIAGGLGLWLGGRRLMLVCGGGMTFIAFSGFWSQALLSLYLMILSVILALAIGMPLGVATARSNRLQRVMSVIIDTIQTLPTFVYLIPIVMILGPGELSALIAIVIYAVTPAIRYTDAALRGVPTTLVEAGRIAGATRAQSLAQVEIPAARPALILGVNQTVMMAFGMLVISALAGTRGLEQETLLALSKADPGRGIIAGLAMAALAMIMDRLLSAWAGRGPVRRGM